MFNIMEIPGRRRGVLREISSVVGVWIFSGTTHFLRSTNMCSSNIYDNKSYVLSSYDE